MENIIDSLFPKHEKKNATIWPAGETLAPVTNAELRQAARSLKTKKAPGVDEVPNKILKRIVELRPGIILDVYNRCITESIFPT